MYLTGKMPIYLCVLKYKVKYYGKRKKEVVLLDKFDTKFSREVCLGNTLDVVNNKKYNEYMISRLENENAKSFGCEIEITSVEPVVQLGYTNNRFEEDTRTAS